MLKDDCLCGHDRCHHYLHTDGRRYCCNALYCDCNLFRKPEEDKKYALRPIDRDEAPDTPRTNINKPHLDASCTCRACRRWLGFI